jgi:hypothetical protein
VWVASLFPFVVGIVRWHTPERYLTVIVKATYDLSSSGHATLNTTQLGLAGDYRGMLPGGAQALEHASDFSPLKARAEVLLVGHAHAATAVNSIPITLRVDDMIRRAVVRCPVATNQALLCQSSITTDGEPRLAPRAAQGPDLSQPLGAGFDFATYNVAARDQQVEHLNSAAQLGLTGLLQGGVHRDVRLPGHRPELYFVPSRTPGAVVQQIAVVCDTLWIHSDRELATLCWRGSLPLPSGAGEEAFVAVSERSRGQGWELLDAQLDDANWVRAQQLPPNGPPAELPLSTHGSPGVASPSSRTAPFSIEPDTKPRGAPTSANHPEEPAPHTRAPHTVAASLDSLTSQPALPFEDGPIKDLPPALQRAIAAMGNSNATGTLLLEEDEAEPDRALPFASNDDDRPTNRPPDEDDDPESTTQQNPKRPPSDVAPDSIEPAPDTPRAGVRLGVSNDGGGLGGFTLSSGSRPETTLPFQKNAAGDAKERPSRPDAGTQTGIMSIDNLVGPALPFDGREEKTPPAPSAFGRPASGGHTITTMDRAALGLPPSGELPFGPRAHHSAKTPEPPMTAPPRRLAPISGAAPYAPAPARPSSPGFAVPPPAPSRPSAPGSPSSPGHAPAPSQPRNPSPPPPKPAPEPRLPVQTFAAIKAALMTGDRPLPAVLDEHQLDERRWRASERRMSLDLAREATEGKTALATELRQAIEQARSAAKPEPSSEDIELEEYAALRAEIDEADDPAAAMRELGLDDARWTAMRRSWSRRCLADRALATRLREALTRARGALRKQRSEL